MNLVSKLRNKSRIEKSKFDEYQRWLELSNIGCSDKILGIINDDDPIITSLNNLNIYYDEKEVESNFKNSKIIIFCIDKHYFESNIFKEQLEKAVKLKKQVFLVILSEQEKFIFKDSRYVNFPVFEIYKNYDDIGFIIGHETESLLKKLEKVLDSKIVNKIFTLKYLV